MSVYIKENPNYLEKSLKSIFEQSIPPDQIVVVCDGPLTLDLEQVIQVYVNKAPNIFNIIRLDMNQGLGEALRQGLLYCRNEYIARMDSDDISYFARCEKQLIYMQQNELELCSATVQEFIDDLDHLTQLRKLPIQYEEIKKYARRRNPINHPCVMFTKTAVQQAGSYCNMPYFEDYYLWVRMFLQGVNAGNIPEPLLYMRTNTKLYQRRGGLYYCKCIASFFKKVYQLGFITWGECLWNIIVRSVVSLLPNAVRATLYRKFLRVGGTIDG